MSVGFLGEKKEGRRDDIILPLYSEEKRKLVSWRL